MGCPTLAICAPTLGTGHTPSWCGLARSEAAADRPQRLAKPGHPSGWLWASEHEANDCVNNQEGEEEA